MSRRAVLRAVVLTHIVLSLVVNAAAAQPKSLRQQIVGAWMIVGCEVIGPDGSKGPLVFGNNPLGQFIFTESGRFAFQETAEFPKFVSGDFRKTTPEENAAVAKGSMAYFGTYSIIEADRTIALHIERSSIPNLNDTDGKRVITALSADEMNWTNPAPIGGGSISCTNKRAK